MMEKIKSISVGANDDYVIWPVSLEGVAKNTILTVSSGCIVLYIVDGMLKSINVPGRCTVNTREEVRSRSSIQLIAVNTDKTFDIFCGVGTIPFHDFDLDIDATVGAFGDCRVNISNAWALYNSIGRAPLTADDVAQYAKAKMIEIMKSVMAEAAQKFDYDEIISRQSDIADAIKKRFSKELINIGIEVSSFALRGIRFSDEYIAQRDEHFKNEKAKKEAKSAAREEERRRRAELENVISIAQATAGMAPPAAPLAPATPAQDHSVQFCTKCGTKLPAAAKFCSGCGQKL